MQTTTVNNETFAQVVNQNTMENTMTKSDLLEIAKTLDIKGRHDMTKSDLQEAIDAAKAFQVQDSFGGNFIPTKPFRVRRYHYSGVTKQGFYDELPRQAKGIFDYVVENNIKASGKMIVDGAKEKGYIKTTQQSDILFAFYARKLEDAGLILAS